MTISANVASFQAAINAIARRSSDRAKSVTRPDALASASGRRGRDLSTVAKSAEGAVIRTIFLRRGHWQAVLRRVRPELTYSCRLRLGLNFFVALEFGLEADAVGPKLHLIT